VTALARWTLIGTTKSGRHVWTRLTCDALVRYAVTLDAEPPATRGTTSLAAAHRALDRERGELIRQAAL